MKINLREAIDKLLKMGPAHKYHTVFTGYITHIRFPRYKNIVSGSRIDFDFPVTALVGANGSGKTSVLHALYGAPIRNSTGHYWFSTKVDPIEEGDGSPNRFIYGHYNKGYKNIVETRKARVKKRRNGREDPNYWEPTKETLGDGMEVPTIPPNGKEIEGRSLDRWNPVSRKVLYINFRKELSAFDKYFYFGKDPIGNAQSQRQPRGQAIVKTTSSRRILSKMDQVRHDSHYLAQVIAAGDTSSMFRGKKIALENRLLEQQELEIISFVLGRNYTEARWIKHRLFKGDGGLSVVFKTDHGRYSEAFAGSGEVAVVSCVVQILAATEGTLVLLDEPEVSLHPGAQERLLAFLADRARTKKIQVVFSTHSPHLISALPANAIKSFSPTSSGEFSITPATHPYAAFRQLGVTDAKGVLVIVEDRLAKLVVTQALALIEDTALRDTFDVEYLPGGADAILTTRIPTAFMHSTTPVLVLLDGDKKKIESFTDPEGIPEADNQSLASIIQKEIGVEPRFLIDGGTGGGNENQRFAQQREYMTWIRRHLRYMPNSSPEEIVLRAAKKLPPTEQPCAKDYKDYLHELASTNRARAATSEEADEFGGFLIGDYRQASEELKKINRTLQDFLKEVKSQSSQRS